MNGNPFDVAISQYQESKKSPFDIAEKSLKEPISFENDEDIQRDIERNIARGTSRQIESVLGLPGDLINFASGIFGYDTNIPGSKKFEEYSEKLTGGFTKPKTDIEKKSDELLQDVTTFALPGAKHYSIARNIGIPVVANLAKEGVKYLDGDEKIQSAAKIGTMVILDILSHRAALGTAKEFSSNLFQKADESIPKGLSIKADILKNDLNLLEKTLLKGGSQPDTVEALQKIKELKDTITDKGFIDLKELVAFRPSINKWIDKLKGFEVNLPDSLRRQAINHLNNVKGIVIKNAEEYGSKYNPEYLKLSRSANESYSAVQQSNKITNFIEKHASSKIKSTGLKALLGLGSVSAFGGGIGILGGALGTMASAAAGLGYKAFKTILRSKSPTLRKHYFDILEGASKGNASEVIRNVKFLDNVFQEMENTGEFVED